MALPAKTLFSIACLLFLPAALAIDSPKIIRSGWYPWDPYQYTVVKDDMKQLTGLDVQLVRAAFQRLGYEVVCDEVSWAQHQHDVQIGARDIAAGAFQSAQRAEYAASSGNICCPSCWVKKTG